MFKKLQEFIDDKTRSEAKLEIYNNADVVELEAQTIDSIDASMLGLVFRDSEGNIEDVKYLTGLAAARIYLGLDHLLYEGPAVDDEDFDLLGEDDDDEYDD